MRVRNWVGGVAAVVLIAVVGPAQPALALESHLAERGPAVNETVGVATNLNSAMFAAVRKDDGHVLFRHRVFGLGVDRDFEPPRRATGGFAQVKRLAVSADSVFAVTDENILYWANVTTGGFGWYAANVVDVLASRDGRIVTAPNGPSRLDPNLYLVHPNGLVTHVVGQEHRFLDGASAGVGSLVERGPMGSTRLFLRTPDGTQVRAWNGSGWDTIGGPSAQLAANLTSLMMTERGSGAITIFDDASRTWNKMAMPAGSPVPIGPGGRFWLGARSVYYRPASSNDLWGVRFAPLLPPAAPLQVTPWWLLSRAAMVQVAGFEETDHAESFALAANGNLAQINWGRPGLAPAGTPHLVVGVDITYRTAALRDWTGKLTVVGVTGTPVPGLTTTIRPDGILEVTGRPTAEGRFMSTISVLDSTGGVEQVLIDYTVHPAGTAGTSTSNFTNPSRATSLVNCGPDPSSPRAWYRDRTTDGSWTELPPLPSARVTTASGWRCDPTTVTATLVPTPPGHVVELAIVYPTFTFCGADDPTVIGCRHPIFITGTDDPPTTIEL